MNSAFRLVVIAIVTIAILFVISNLLVYQDEDTITELKKGIAFAEANEGLSHKVELAFKKDFVARADLLDNVDRSVRFECNSDRCSGDIASISPRSLLFREQTLMDVYFRCQRKELIQDCVIYFGEEPAQVQLKLLGFPDTIENGVTTTIGFQVENSGLLDALGLNYEILIFRKNSENGLLLAEDPIKDLIEKLSQGQSKTIFKQSTINIDGNYILKISVEGEDAGYAFVEKEFAVIGESISPNCKVLAELRPYLNGDVCRTEYSCTDCQNATECAVRWKEKGLNVEIGSKEKAYIETASDGSC
ncbi:hypothetical protein IIC68_02980 [archaeon]|nr:hypothetical protein [archaeon]